MASSSAMAAPASTRPYDECESRSACLPVTLDANLLSPAVTLTLTSIRRTQDGTRHIVLHPDEPVIIGRSSRSEVKNLSSSTNNALFDCPVVSRRHAEFTLNMNKWDAKEMHKIYITDTESMHGTSVNNQKLQPLKRFHLRVGDVIRLGDSVNHGQSEHPLTEVRRVASHADNISDSYDGVMVTLDCISVAGQKESAKVKSAQRGISCPSGSDFDSDDDSVEEVDAPSSAQTTPDQPAEKPKMKKLVPFGSSIANGIILDDDNEPQSVAAVPRITARSIVVPDTYAEDSYDAPDNAPNVERTLRFDETVTDHSRTAADDDVEETVSDDGGEDSEMHFSDDVQSQASNDDNTSDAASSHHSSDSEAESMSDFHDDDEEGEWAEQDEHLHYFIHDDRNEDPTYSTHDDQDEEEGPEVMSSKRTQSVEIGTSGDASNYHDYQPEPSDAPPREPAAPARPHYDPVRGMFQVATAPFMDNAPTVRAYDSFPPPSHSGVYADVWNSSKWDVGPTDVVANNFTFPQSFPYAPSEGAWAPPKYAPVHSEWSALDNPNLASMHNICDGSKKRKASEISIGFEPMATAPEFQPSTAEGTQAPHPSFVFPERVQHEDHAEESFISAATEEPLTVEPQPKRLKTCQPRTKKNMLRTAAIEATKYTAGAIIGGIGIVTILASPLGEVLASC